MILQHCDKKQFTIITGARKTGKTTLLKELEKHLRVQGKEVHYLTFENRTVLAEVDQHPDSLFRFIPAISGIKMKTYICIDEKFTDSLAGRKDIFNLSTLNFEEYLIFNKRESLVPELKRIRSDPENLSINMPELRILFDEYLFYGGYPGVVLEKKPEHKIGRLEEMRDSFLKRDMLESSVRDEIIKEYIAILQKCFHVELLSPYHSNPWWQTVASL